MATSQPASDTSPTADTSPSTWIIVAALAITLILIVVIMLVFHRYRHKCCGSRLQNKADVNSYDPAKELIDDTFDYPYPSSQEPMIEAQIQTNGLQSGRRSNATRTKTPRKWFDSAAIKYMDQSMEDISHV